ncbi:MAG: alanine racemase, partial [Lewinella sp.]|nr:alanine racemase [Lewinella sp.]
LVDHRYVYRSPRSYNSQLGVPLALLGLNDQHELALIEAGISRTGEMTRLAAMIQPTIGIFTNIGEAHQEGFASREEKLAEKLLLFDNAEHIIYCADQPLVHQQMQRRFSGRLLAWSREQATPVKLRRISQGSGQTTLFVETEKPGAWSFTIPFVDDNSVENAMHACCLLYHLGLAPDEIARRMARLTPVDFRLRLRAGQRDSTLIDDSYSNDLTSLANALNLLDRQGQPDRPRGLILSDLLETGLPDQEWCRRVAAMVRERIQFFVGVGEKLPAISTFLPPELPTFFFPTTADLLQALPELPWPGSLLLVKGARVYQLEQVTNRLARQIHRTELEIHLDRLRHNLAVFQESLAADSSLAVMIKAAAYGSGGPEVARVLAREGVRYLVVAYPDEGRDLRLAGIDHPIFVLNAGPDSYPLLAQYGLEPEVYHWDQLRGLREAGSFAIHLKFDTGMHRLGFRPEEASRLGSWLRDHSGLRVASVMTHLAASEAPEHDAFTHEQVRRFEQAYAALVDRLGYRPIRHVLNSSGILRFPQYHFEMVRLGIGLYGIAPGAAMGPNLQPVLRLQARISQIHAVASGETVGYGRAGRLSRDSRIATLAIGYADGLPRAAGHQRFAVSIHDQPAPIIGAVCMDMCMVDVTDIPTAREGDLAIVFGDQPRVEALARAAGTIPYEILTGLSERVHRIYLQE